MTLLIACSSRAEEFAASARAQDPSLDVRIAPSLGRIEDIRYALAWHPQPGLLKTLQYNLNRQQERVRIFETGLRFNIQGNEIKQENTLSVLLFGPRFPLQWGTPEEAADFADLKADLEALAALAGEDGLSDL